MQLGVSWDPSLQVGVSRGLSVCVGILQGPNGQVWVMRSQCIDR